MRIIGQNGEDYPYKSTFLTCKDGKIYAAREPCTAEGYVIAKYSNQADAMMVMRALQDSYKRGPGNQVFKFPGEDEM